jgi:hypothetical protein
MSTNLSEENRKKLDSIVMKMEANGESEDDIRFVVGDFKNKYSAPEKQPQGATRDFGPETPDFDPYANSTTMEKLLPSTMANKGNFSTVTDMSGKQYQTNVNPLQLAGDVMGIPTRALGSATGQGSMADPESGIMRPVRERMSETMKDPEAGYFKKGLAGMGYLGASVLEDPTTFTGAGLSKTVGKGINLATQPIRKGIEQTGEAVLKIGDKVPSYIKDVAKTPIELSSDLASGAGDMAKFGAEKLGKITPTPTKTANLLDRRAIKTQQIILKPSERDFKHGLKLENIPKYGIQGSAKEVYKKSDELISQASNDLRRLIQEGRDNGAYIDAKGILKDLEDEIFKNTSEKAKFGDLQELQKAFKHYEKEIDLLTPSGQGYLDLADGQTFKQTIGDESTWEHVGKEMKAMIPSDAKARSKLASRFYLKLKDAIEKSAPEGEIKSLNRIMADLIPIKNASKARMTVQERNLPWGLRDMAGGMASLSGGPKAWAFWGALKLQDSPIKLKAFHGIAKKLRGSKEPKDISRYTNALKKLGITEAGINAIKAGKDITSGLPKIGEEKDGYIFKGGDPSQEKNWAKK